MNPITPDFTYIDHTADIGIIVNSPNIQGLFTKSGQALIFLLFNMPISSQGSSLVITQTGTDYADLMVRWLGELLYLFQGEQLIATSIEIDKITPFHLSANLKTIPFDARRHKPQYEIKAVTYHKIAVTQIDSIWRARIIFDI